MSFARLAKRFAWAGVARTNRIPAVRRAKRAFGRIPFSIRTETLLGPAESGVAANGGRSSITLPEGFAFGSAPTVNVAAFFIARLAGLAAISPMWEHLGLSGWWLNGVWVHPAFRGMGLGERVILAAERAAAVANIGEINLNVRADNAAAIALYRKLGYGVLTDPAWNDAIRSHLSETAPLEEHLLMRKRIR